MWPGKSGGTGRKSSGHWTTRTVQNHIILYGHHMEKKVLYSKEASQPDPNHGTRQIYSDLQPTSNQPNQLNQAVKDSPNFRTYWQSLDLKQETFSQSVRAKKGKTGSQKLTGI